ncbi:S-adenosyl-L-methionine-dependent methyltransferase [Aspergillus floccosus]
MAEADNYPLGRNIFHSVRLDAQHLLWRLHTGYILHPRVPVTDNMKIAELGTGTGVWLFEAAKSLPPTTQLHGFDISDEQFPPREPCPPNVRFEIMDSFVDPPISLVGQYDVVHLRMWASNFRNRDPGAILHHVMELLKPGGFIQWEEADLTHQMVVGEKAKQFEARVNKLFGQAGLDYSWVPSLPRRVKQAGFILIEFERQQFGNLLTNLCTNTYLLALQEILQGIRKSSSSDVAQATMEHEIALHHLSTAERKRIVYNWSPTKLLGQKPSEYFGFYV